MPKPAKKVEIEIQGPKCQILVMVMGHWWARLVGHPDQTTSTFV